MLAFGFAVSAGEGTARGGDSATPMQTEAVLMKLHHSNQMEIAAGKLAQRKGRSKDVKTFGKTLVTDHSAADKKCMALAKDEKITLPKSEPTPDDAMNKLKAALAGDFDKMFAADMLGDHEKAIAEVKAARDVTTDGRLKALLNSLLPVLEAHRDTAQRLTAKFGPSASSRRDHVDFLGTDQRDQGDDGPDHGVVPHGR
jgi:putative membrane protein